MTKSTKSFWGFLPTLLLLVSMVCVISCKGDDTDPEAEQIAKLSAAWRLGTVMNDNVDVTNQFTGFTLSVDGLTYRTQNGGSPWPASGTYEFLVDNLNVLRRDDNTLVTISELTEDTLVLAFNFSGTGGIRAGINGSFIFSLTK